MTYVHYPRVYEDEERPKFQRRVAFIAHMLRPGDYSTAIIDWMLALMGTSREEFFSRPFFIKWLSFPVMPPVGSDGEPVWVDFYLIPALATDFMPKVRDSTAYKWCEAVALHAIAEAERDGVELWIGWGAGTKNATDHGKLFLDRNESLNTSPTVNTTHGDGGTTVLAVNALGQAGVPHGVHGAIIGAAGAIGKALAMYIPLAFEPETWMLVGRADKEGETVRRQRLEQLRAEIEAQLDGQVRTQLSMSGRATTVMVHQDKRIACHDAGAQLILVATTAGEMELLPGDVPSGALVVDLTTPSSCSSKHDWSDRTVITAGCGQFTNSEILPFGFGKIAGEPVTNVGAAVKETGGNRVLWGCTGDTIIRAMFNQRGHIAGQNVDISDLRSIATRFRDIGFKPQPPVSFGRLLSWEQLRGTGNKPTITYGSFPAVNGNTSSQ